jgi:hypothetical protein
LPAIGEYLVGTTPFAGEFLSPVELAESAGGSAAQASAVCRRPLVGEMSGLASAEASMLGQLAFGGQATGSAALDAIVAGVVLIEPGESVGVGLFNASGQFFAMTPDGGGRVRVATKDAAADGDINFSTTAGNALPQIRIGV